MLIHMSESRTKGAAKRMRKVLREMGIDLKYMECLNLSVQLLGFKNYQQFCHRDLDVPQSPLDDRLSEVEFAARDEFQMSVLVAAGLGHVARDLLDRANPTGPLSRQYAEEMPEG